MRGNCPPRAAPSTVYGIKWIRNAWDLFILRTYTSIYSTLYWLGTTLWSIIWKKIESTHCKTVRLMTLHGPLQNFHFGAHEMFKNMNLLKTEDIYKLEMAKFMYRMYHKRIIIKSISTQVVKSISSGKQIWWMCVI